jgi:hypothetical protein
MPRSKDDGGYPPIPVKDASFVADFALGDGETPSIAWAIGNLGGGFHLRGGETGTKRLLGGMASRVSGLFDVPPADVKHVAPDGLSIALSTEGKTHRIKVKTPKSGPYSDWWLRIDTNVGEFEVTAPGQALLKDVPETGAKIAVYAISPDGKIWHSASREIRAE